MFGPDHKQTVPCFCPCTCAAKFGEYDNVQDAFFKCYVDIIFNSRDDWCVFLNL